MILLDSEITAVESILLLLSYISYVGLCAVYAKLVDMCCKVTTGQSDVIEEAARERLEAERLAKQMVRRGHWSNKALHSLTLHEYLFCLKFS